MQLDQNFNNFQILMHVNTSGKFFLNPFTSLAKKKQHFLQNIPFQCLSGSQILWVLRMSHV